MKHFAPERPRFSHALGAIRLSVLVVLGVGVGAVAAFAALSPWGTTTRVNVSATGQEANTDFVEVGVGGFGARASADGRYVVFGTGASNLVPVDSNGHNDVFLRDREGRSTTLVSVSSEEVQSSGLCFAGDVTADGRYVFFQASGADLLADDNNDSDDILVRDTQLGTTTRAVLGWADAEPNGSTYQLDVTPDGKYLAVQSAATNLVSIDSNGVVRDVFRRDLSSGENVLVSVDSDENQVDSDSRVAGISDNGRYVAFTSSSATLVTGDENGAADLFLRDVQEGTTTRLSVDSDEKEAAMGVAAGPFALSADGRFAVFETASKLDEADTNNGSDIYLRDNQAGTTSLVTLGSGGVPADSGCYDGAISADGGYVAFQSAATNLVPGGTSGATEVWVRDLADGSLARASIGASGAPSNGFFADMLSVGNGGAWVMFQSAATNLVSPDNNNADDLFIREYGDFAKPITTSDVKTTYVDQAVIKLTATDTGGSGVALTKYKVDAGAWQTGTTVTVSSPGAHTVRYYSVDIAGNAENTWTKPFFVWGSTRFSLTKPSVVPAYNSAVKLTARLTNKAGAALPNKTIVFEYRSGSNWVRSASAVTNSSGYAYHYAAGLTTARTYRARFAGASPYLASAYAGVGLLPKARLMRSTSWSTLAVNKTYYAKGYIEPKHAASDTNKVRIRAYKKGSDGKYRYVRSYTAAYGSSYKTTSGYKTAYKATVKITSKGTWKLVAYHAADARNAATAGSADYVTVK